MITDMATNIASMKPNDWTAIAFGFTGFLLSLITLLRSLSVDRRSSKSVMEQKLLKILLLCSQAEISVRTVQLKVLDIEDEAKEEGMNEIQDVAKSIISNAEELLRQMALMNEEASRPLPDRSQWLRMEVVLHEAEKHLQGYVTQASTSEVFIRSAKANIRLKKKITEQERALRNTGNRSPEPPAEEV